MSFLNLSYTLRTRYGYPQVTDVLIQDRALDLSTATVQIRRAQLSDLLSISDIELRSAKHEGRMKPLNFSLDKMYELWHQRFMTGEFEILVSVNSASGEEVITGFLAARVPMRGEAFVQAIYIDPQYFHRGIGSALMSAGEQIMRLHQCPQVKLYLEPGNKIGFKFYSGLGFTRTSQRYHHLHIMVKELRAC